MKHSCRSTESFKMQNEVRGLLDLSTHSVSNDSPLVSPEGLGSSDLSSLESIGKPAGHPLGSSLRHLEHGIMKSNFSKYPSPTQPSAGHSAPCLRPEDDILYQWRLRRKMEQSGHQFPSAVQLTLPHSSFSGLPQQTLSNVVVRDQWSPGTGTMAQTSPDICAQEPPPNMFTFPHPSLSQFQPQHPHISPPAPHHSCVLPCPLQSSPISLSKERKPHRRQSSTDPDTCPQLATDRLSFKNTSGADNQPNKPHSALHQRVAADKEGHCRASEKSRKGRRAVTSQGEGTKAEKGGKRNGTSSSRETGSKGSRCVRPVDHVIQPDLARGGGDGDGKRLKQRKERRENSALQSTLGKVVSEVLFPDSESASTSRISSTTDSYEDSRSSQPFSPPHGPQRPSEIINDLLIEAEDSDGLEFEDDPLLQVLREQRERVKQRICDVDKLLDAWHEKQPL